MDEPVRLRFFRKSDIENKNKKNPAGMLATEVRAGDAPKPQNPKTPKPQISDISKVFD